MRFLVLCCDYDGTLASDGQVLAPTVAALRRLVASGRRVVLVTGRELDDLKLVCPCLALFEYVVAENGALLYQPATGEETPLAPQPPESFIATLRARGVGPISVGRVIVATWEPHEAAVLETIKDQGLELQVIFNKGAVMVLPAGVTKATGLRAALGRMRLSAHNAVGIGDAENDHALLRACECGVAVANALPTLKSEASFVTRADHGAGVAELIGELLADDLASHEGDLTRHHILLGWDVAEHEIRISPYGENVLVLAPDGQHEPLYTGLLERLTEKNYTYCLLAGAPARELPAGVLALGTPERAPAAQEILKLFQTPDQSGRIDLSALSAAQQLAFLGELLPRVQQLRAHLGRPHWLVLDGAEQLLEAVDERQAAAADLESVLQIATRPERVARWALQTVGLLILVGEAWQQRLQAFCEAAGMAVPAMGAIHLKPGEALAWRPQDASAPFALRLPPRHWNRTEQSAARM